MNKKDLRKIYKLKRKAFTVSEKLKLDDLLLINFQKLALGDPEYLLSYFPKEDYKEPNTLLFTRYLSHFSDVLKIAYPLIHVVTGTMDAVLADDSTEFVLNGFGISEPDGGMVVRAELIDMVFVPLLCFDKNGYRVGYGGGYYDKYLTKCKEAVIKVGFSYFEAIDKISDKDSFDVPLNFCITPERIYEFK